MIIYVITHKIFKQKYIKNKEIYQPLLVGASIGNKGNRNCLLDNTGKNISWKNKNYCELTGIYWIWKNSSQNIVGVDHYRRYFVKNLRNKKLLSRKDIDKSLKDYDIILPQRDPLIFQGKTAAQFFGDCHDPLVWTLCRDIIKDRYSTYIKDFDWYSKQTTGYCYNMFISTKELIDKYNSWIFTILKDLEIEIDLSEYDSYNQRMMGFVSERLLNVWIHHNNLKVKEYPVFFTGKESIKQRLINKVVRIRAKKRLKNRKN